MSAQFRNACAVRTALSRAAQQLRPPPKQTPAEWVEDNVRIPAGNAKPGPLRFSNAPYQAEIVDACFDADVERITLMWAAQVGKTLIALAAQAAAIALIPRSQMMCQPSQGDMTTWLETKFVPLTESTPAVGKKLARPRSRQGVNNRLIKGYPGGHLMLAWAGSPKTLRGRSAPLIIADEVDGYEVTEEGHPVSLLWQRAATFGDERLLLEISTPTVKGHSYIEKAFLDGDQRRWYVRCPHCDEAQTLVWQNVSWQGRQADAAADLAEFESHQPDTARYTCSACGVLLSDGERWAAIRRGEWIAAKPTKRHRSYHLNELNSTFRKLRDIVQSYLDKLSQGDLQAFYNVSLSETWEEAGQEANSDDIANRAETFSHEVPAGGLVLTCGVDMQQDRLEAEVVAWGAGEESWSVEHKVFHGDPLGPDPWSELEEYLQRDFESPNGPMRISATCVDTGGTGGYTQAAYDWLRGKTGRRIFAVKGVGGWDRPVVSAPSRKRSGKDARKVDLYTVGTDQSKLAILRRLALTQPGPGFMHTPIERDVEWYAQLCAEKLVTRKVKGFPVREWHKTRDRNEALDCRVYAYAALKLLNPDLARKAARQAAAPAPAPQPAVPARTHLSPLQRLTAAPAPAPEPPPPVATRKKSRMRIAGGGRAL